MELEQNLKKIEEELVSLNKRLTEAQNNKLTAEVHLASEKEELASIEDNLKQLTGISSIDEIGAYISNRESELSCILNDLQKITTTGNFTEQDVINIKDLVQKYNIPICGDIQ